MGDADGADDAGAAPHAAHLVRPGQRGENEGESAQGEPIGMWAMTLCTPTTATRTTSADGVPLRAVLAALVGIGFEVDVDAEMQDLLTAGWVRARSHHGSVPVLSTSARSTFSHACVLSPLSRCRVLSCLRIHRSLTCAGDKECKRTGTLARCA
jgi:hypothetical protein